MSKRKPNKVFSVALANGGVAYALARHGKGAKGVISAEGMKPSLTVSPREVDASFEQKAVNFKSAEVEAA
jgi:hypothetical protein